MTRASLNSATINDLIEWDIYIKVFRSSLRWLVSCLSILTSVSSIASCRVVDMIRSASFISSAVDSIRILWICSTTNKNLIRGQNNIFSRNEKTHIFWAVFTILSTTSIRKEMFMTFTALLFSIFRERYDCKFNAFASTSIWRASSKAVVMFCEWKRLVTKSLTLVLCCKKVINFINVLQCLFLSHSFRALMMMNTLLKFSQVVNSVFSRSWSFDCLSCTENLWCKFEVDFETKHLVVAICLRILSRIWVDDWFFWSR